MLALPTAEFDALYRAHAGQAMDVMVPLFPSKAPQPLVGLPVPKDLSLGHGVPPARRKCSP